MLIPLLPIAVLPSVCYADANTAGFLGFREWLVIKHLSNKRFYIFWFASSNGFVGICFIEIITLVGSRTLRGHCVATVVHLMHITDVDKVSPVQKPCI